MEWLTNFISKFTPLSSIFVATFTVFIIWLRAHLTAKEKHKYWLIHKRSDILAEFFETIQTYTSYDRPQSVIVDERLMARAKCEIQMFKSSLFINKKDRDAFKQNTEDLLTLADKQYELILKISKRPPEKDPKYAEVLKIGVEIESLLESIKDIFDKNLKSPKWH